tara:strand:- start:2399 stop:3286 length:888 start_codon:yes stop_codon:yes gene_type:complete
LDRFEFIDFIVNQGSFNKEVYKVCFKVDNFSFAPEILNKLDGNINTDIILTSNEVNQIKSAKEKLISNLANDLIDTSLKKEIIKFLNDLAEIKIGKNLQKNNSIDKSDNKQKMIQELKEMRESRVKNEEEKTSSIKNYFEYEEIPRPSNQELMINLGYFFNTLYLIYYPIQLHYLFNYVEIEGVRPPDYFFGFFYLIYLFIGHPLLCIFQFQICNQLKRGDFENGLENIKTLGGISLSLSSLIILESLFRFDVFPIVDVSLTTTYIFHIQPLQWYWLSPVHKKYYESITQKNNRK